MYQMIFKTRVGFIYLAITLIGWAFVIAAEYTGNLDWYLLGMAPLFASMPIVIAWGLFIEWATKDTSKKGL